MTTRPAAEDTACANARLAMSLVLDCEAEAADAHRAASHLRSCARCRLFACEVASFTRALRSRATGPSERRQDDRAGAAL